MPDGRVKVIISSKIFYLCLLLEKTFIHNFISCYNELRVYTNCFIIDSKLCYGDFFSCYKTLS